MKPQRTAKPPQNQHKTTAKPPQNHHQTNGETTAKTIETLIKP